MMLFLVFILDVLMLFQMMILMILMFRTVDTANETLPCKAIFPSHLYHLPNFTNPCLISVT